jgi:hypothetical protein
MEGKAILKKVISKLFFNSLNFYRYGMQALKYSSSQKPNLLYDAIIGDLLGDGHIRYSNRRKDKKKTNIGNARMEFTFSTQNLPYVQYLKFVAYQEICTPSLPTP